MIISNYNCTPDAKNVSLTKFLVPLALGLGYIGYLYSDDNIPVVSTSIITQNTQINSNNNNSKFNDFMYKLWELGSTLVDMSIPDFRPSRSYINKLRNNNNLETRVGNNLDNNNVPIKTVSYDMCKGVDVTLSSDLVFTYDNLDIDLIKDMNFLDLANSFSGPDCDETNKFESEGKRLENDLAQFLIDYNVNNNSQLNSISYTPSSTQPNTLPPTNWKKTEAKRLDNLLSAGKIDKQLYNVKTFCLENESSVRDSNTCAVTYSNILFNNESEFNVCKGNNNSNFVLKSGEHFINYDNKITDLESSLNHLYYELIEMEVKTCDLSKFAKPELERLNSALLANGIELGTYLDNGDTINKLFTEIAKYE